MNHDISCADFPIGKSPIEESVDPLIIGDWGFVVSVNCVRVNRELPSRDIPISEEGDNLWVAIGLRTYGIRSCGSES